ncbi:MAG: 2-C-methyl-D-erythritol 4-phosphate cytidylyltransferase [Bacteroidales bacterium]
MLKKFVIITAGGKGERMLSATPKQFLLIKNKPILYHAINSFYKYDKSINIIVTLPKEYISHWKKLCEKHKIKIKHTIVSGGNTRFHSVKNALNIIKDDSIIAIHDGVRPFVSEKLISNIFKVAEKNGNAIPVLLPNESMREKIGNVNVAVDRKFFYSVQTPQCFKSAILKKAYEQNFSPSFTDDATVVEQLGLKIFMVEGERENIKITTPLDFDFAKVIFEKNRR